MGNNTPKTSSSRGHVLVVDDEEEIRSLWSEFLTSLGYEVEAVATGVAALTAAKERRPDTVVLDLHLPGGAIDGPDVLKVIRREIPVIVVTGDVRLGLSHEMVAAGAFDVIDKPVDLQDLARAVGAAVAVGRRGRPPRE